MVLEHKEHSTKPMDENRAQIEFMENQKLNRTHKSGSEYRNPKTHETKQQLPP
jgi:hypothetical protein